MDVHDVDADTKNDCDGEGSLGSVDDVENTLEEAPEVHVVKKHVNAASQIVSEMKKRKVEIERKVEKLKKAETEKAMRSSAPAGVVVGASLIKWLQLSTCSNKNN